MFARPLDAVVLERRPVGLRPRYYSDNNEDALIMTTDPLDDAGFRARIERLRVALDETPAPTGPFEPDEQQS